MPRLLALLIAVLTGLAASEPTIIGGPQLRQMAGRGGATTAAQATQAAWPAGRRTLTETVALLAATGNPTTVTGDDGLAQDLPAFAGTYWEGVAEICRRFAARPLAGPVVAEGDGVAVAGGPVELIRDGAIAAAWRPAGAIALIDAPPAARTGGKDGTVRLVVRLEPARGLDGIWGVATDTPTDGPPQVRITFSEPFSAALPLRPGTLIDLDLGGLPGEVSLRQQGALWQLRTVLPADRLPTATAVAALFSVRLDLDGKPLRPRNTAFGNLRTGTTDQVVRTLRFPELADAEHQVTITGQALIGETTFPIGAPPEPGTDPRAAPATVAWEAGRRSLAEAIGPLAGGGGIVTELGVDARAMADVPACNGTWWDGVLCVARAFGLTILPPPLAEGDEAPQAVSFATVCLGRPGEGRSRLDEFQVNGSALVTATLTPGEPATITAQIRLEPRFAAIDPSDLRITWEATADLAGQSVAVTDATAADRTTQRGAFQMVRIGRRFVASSVPAGGAGRPAVSSQVTVPAGASGSLRVGVTITMISERPVRTELPLQPGPPQVVRLGELALLAQIVAAADAADAGLPAGGTYLTLSGLGADDASVMAGPPGGPLLTCDGPMPMRQRRPARLAWALPAPGAQQVAISTLAAAQPVVLPVRFVVAIPPG
jgi:hypothetical protein